MFNRNVYAVTANCGINKRACSAKVIVLIYNNDNRWKTGDMEFEGKIFDAYFYESYRSQYGYFSADDYFVFLKFAETRDSSSFDNAIKVLYNKFGYSKDDFPMNENMSYYNRTVHIDTLK